MVVALAQRANQSVEKNDVNYYCSGGATPSFQMMGRCQSICMRQAAPPGQKNLFMDDATDRLPLRGKETTIGLISPEG